MQTIFLNYKDRKTSTLLRTLLNLGGRSPGEKGQDKG